MFILGDHYNQVARDGIGLAICQTITQRHGGKISVAAAKPRGALFRIVLPSVQPSIT
jgi:signal transduction histidine kinase